MGLNLGKISREGITSMLGTLKEQDVLVLGFQVLSELDFSDFMAGISSNCLL